MCLRIPFQMGSIKGGQEKSYFFMDTNVNLPCCTVKDNIIGHDCNGRSYKQHLFVW